MQAKPDKKPGRFRILFLVLAVAVLGYSLWAGAVGLVASMGIAAFLALSLFLFSMTDEFSTFKASASGIEAHMREVVREAEGTVGEIKRLSVLVAKIQLSLLIRQGRFGGYTQAEQEKYRAEILSILGQMGLPDSEKDEAMRDVHRFTLFDLYRGIVCPGGRTRTDVPNEVGSEWATMVNREMDNLPSASEFEALFKKAGMWSGDVKERVEDYRATPSKNAGDDLFQMKMSEGIYNGTTWRPHRIANSRLARSFGSRLRIWKGAHRRPHVFRSFQPNPGCRYLPAGYSYRSHQKTNPAPISPVRTGRRLYRLDR